MQTPRRCETTADGTCVPRRDVPVQGASSLPPIVAPSPEEERDRRTRGIYPPAPPCPCPSSHRGQDVGRREVRVFSSQARGLNVQISPQEGSVQSSHVNQATEKPTEENARAGPGKQPLAALLPSSTPCGPVLHAIRAAPCPRREPAWLISMRNTHLPESMEQSRPAVRRCVTHQPHKWGQCEQRPCRNRRNPRTLLTDSLERPSPSLDLQPVDRTCPAQRGRRGRAPHCFRPPALRHDLCDPESSCGAAPYSVSCTRVLLQRGVGCSP